MAGILTDLRGRRCQRRLPLAFVWALVAASAMPMAVASVAFACTAQAQIQNSTEVARRGEVVTGSARGFSASPAASDIILRLDGDDAVLWQGRADINGSADYSFVVPDLPGHHVVMAYQSGATGQPVAGTPARAPLTIEAPPALTPPKPAIASPPPAPAEPSSVAAEGTPAPQQPLVSPPPPAAEQAPVAAAEFATEDRSPPQGNSVPAGSPSYLLAWLLTGGAVLAVLSALVFVTGSANRRRGEPARRYRP